jgi:hypothetical protein
VCPAEDGGYGLLGVSLLSPGPGLAPSAEDAAAGDGEGSSDTSRGNVSIEKARMLEGMFRGVLWSHPLTALSQIRALQLSSWSSVGVGRLMHDVDSPDDVSSLCRRLVLRRRARQEEKERQQPEQEWSADGDENFGCLSLPTSAPRTPNPTAPAPRCRHTIQALKDLGLLL